MKKLSSTFLLVVFCLIASSASAATNTWTGATSNDWNTATNWSLGVAPGALDGVVIPSVTNYPVIGTTVTIAALVCNAGTLTILQGATLNVITGPAGVPSITINTGGSIINSGQIFVTASAGGVAISMSDNFTNNGSINGTGPINVLTANAILTNSGQFNFSGSAINNAGTINNTGCGYMRFNNLINTGIVTNRASMRIETATNPIAGGGTFTNSGFVSSPSYVISVSSNLGYLAPTATSCSPPFFQKGSAPTVTIQDGGIYDQTGAINAGTYKDSPVPSFSPNRAIYGELTNNNNFGMVAEVFGQGGCAYVDVPINVIIPNPNPAPIVKATFPKIKVGDPATLVSNCAVGTTTNWYLGTPTNFLRNTTNNTLVDASSILVPGVPKEYYARCVDASGCTSAVSFPATVTVIRNPVSANPDQTSVTVCGNSTATLSAQGCNLGDAFVWYDVASGGTFLKKDVFTTTFSVATANPSPWQTVANQTKSYWVACQNELGVESAPRRKIDVNIKPTPVAADIALSPAGGTICDGKTLTLKTISGNSLFSYAWNKIVYAPIIPGFPQSILSVTPVSGAKSAQLDVKTAGFYQVILDYNGCVASSTPVEVIVNPTPTKPTISASGLTTFCDGKNVVLSTVSTETKYSWSSGITTKDLTVTKTGKYAVTVTNSFNCSNTSDSTSVTVNPNPVKPIITASDKTTFCDGNSINLTSSVEKTYAWSTKEITQAITVKVSGKFAVTVTNQFGCFTGSDTTVVTVLKIPAKPTITASATTVCDGAEVTLTSSPEKTYLWASTNETTQAVKTKKTSTYSVTVTNEFGCSNKSDAIAITVNPNPAKPIITADGPTFFCNGGAVNLTSSTEAKYAWSNGSTSRTVPVTASGTFTLKVTNQFNCESVVSDAVSVTVRDLPPTPTISQTGPYTLIAKNSPLGTGYEWKSNGQVLADTSSTIKITKDGDVIVRRFWSYPAPSGGSTIICYSASSNTLRFLDDPNNTGIIIYPNPSNDGKFSLITKDEYSNVETTIWTVTGQLMYKGIIPSFKGSAFLDLSDLAIGDYILSLKLQTDKFFSKRIFVNR